MATCGIGGCTLKPYHAGICLTADLGSRTRPSGTSKEDRSFTVPSTNLDGQETTSEDSKSSSTTAFSQNHALTEASASTLSGSECLPCCEEHMNAPPRREDAGVSRREEEFEAAEREQSGSSDSDSDDSSNPAERSICGLQGCTLRAYHPGLCSVPSPAGRRASANAGASIVARLFPARRSPVKQPASLAKPPKADLAEQKACRRGVTPAKVRRARESCMRRRSPRMPHSRAFLV